MKKQILICGLAALTATTMLFAANDKLTFFKGSKKVRTVRVDDISEITYTDPEDGGFKKMRVAFSDTDPLEMEIDGFDRIDYVEGLPDNPLHVVVEPHYACATLHITTDDPGAYYRVSGCPVADLEGVPEEEWADRLFSDNVAFCQQVAASNGKQLCDFPMDAIFDSGDFDRDWWPSTVLLPDEESVLLFYTGEVEGNDINMTTEPLLVKFRTKKAEVLNTEYDVEVEFNSNTYTVKANARDIEGSDRDIPFYIEVYTKAQVEETGLEQLTVQSLQMLEQIIYRTDRTWADAMYYTSCERTYTNTRVGDEMVAVAYGCEYGVINTPFFTKEFTVPVPEISSDATFELSLDPISTSEYSLSVTPSDSDIKWTGMLVESSRIPDDYSRSAYVSNIIYYENSTNPGWKENERLVHVGAASGISTQSGLLCGNYMSVGKEYSILIFGIDDGGGVITDILEQKVTPKSASTNMKLDMSFSNFRENGNTNYLDVNIVPSDKEAKYVFDYLPDDNACAQLDCTDEEFIERYVSVSGEYLGNATYTGDMQKLMSMTSKYDNTLGVWRFGYYIAFAFGYDGEATSGVYAFKVNAATGEAELIRAPQEGKELTFEVELKDFQNAGNSNHITADVKPSDKDMKYVMDILPNSNSLLLANLSDEEFVEQYTAEQGQYLSNMTYTGDVEKKFAMGQEWNSVLGTWAWGKYTIFIFGYDGEQTSRLLMYEVNAETGEYTQIRGGEPAE